MKDASDIPCVAEVQKPKVQAFGFYTTLYSLTPIGRNSPLSESLPSYLHRLAYAHGGLTALAIYSRYILPQSRRRRLNQISVQGGRATTLLYSTKTSRLAVKSLAELVGQTDLSFLIGERLSDLAQLSQSMRKSWAWCPLCMDEWRLGGKPLYFPLLWSMKSYSVCVAHSVRLVSACPKCGFKPYLLANRNWSAFCRRCGHYQLGKPALPQESVLVDQSSWEWNSSFRTHECFAWLANAQNVSNGIFATNVKELAQAAGSDRALGEALGLDGHSVRYWRVGQRARFESVIRLSVFCGVSVGSLYENAVDSDLIYRAKQLGFTKGENFNGSSELLKEQLTAYLHHPEKISLSKICKQIGVGVNRVRREFPELVSQLKKAYREQRHAKHIKNQQAVVALLTRLIQELASNGEPPTRYRIRKLMLSRGEKNIYQVLRMLKALSQG